VDAEEEAVRAANDGFYAAFGKLDVERMAAVWLHESWVRCIHPTHDLLVGWEEIQSSWAQIFVNATWMRVIPMEVDVRMSGPFALVVCTENITSKREDDVRVSVALATNIFKKTEEGWRMVHHHASPAPVKVTQAFSGTVQ
jgi:uncharacterized protein (TIGR02246 family)